VERYLERPRHIEVQVLGDLHGRLVHVGERECSIQRRHQKLIEEAPASCVDAATRARMGAAAVAAARAAGYHSAGTVEFLWSEGEFYFLEMNTRIQVEHAITEEVYGTDLVAWMLRIAAGEALDLPAEPCPRGHAFEVRINAEDPERGFLPAVGRICNLRLPGGPGIRVDSALYRGMEVSPWYDSMLAKVISYGEDRERALRRMRRALEELNIGGVPTTAGIALEVLGLESFRSGDYDTGTLEGLMAADRQPDLTHEWAAAAVAAMHRHDRARQAATRPVAAGSGLSPWTLLGRRAAREGGLR